MEQMKKRGFDLKTLSIIFALAWPTMLEQFLLTAVQYIDTAMVGSLGTAATAAVGATSTVNWLINGTLSGFSVGFLAYIAQALGAGEGDRARRAAAQSVLVTAAAGIFLTALMTGLSSLIPVWMQTDEAIRPLAARYFLILSIPLLPRAASQIFGNVLRAAGDTKTPLRISVFINLLNIVLNFFLIYPTRDVTVFERTFRMPGAGLGVEGAAVASAIAFTAGGIAVTAALVRHPVISPRGCSLRPDRDILGAAFRVAGPNILQRVATSSGYVVFASMINALGGVATAAHTIANTVESAFYIPGWGMQTAAATLAGNAVGAHDREALHRLSRIFFFLEIGLMLISGTALFAFAGVLMRLFSADEAVIGLGTTVLRMVAVSEPFYGVPIVIEGIMQGCGKTKIPLVFNLIGMWGVRILGTFLFTVILSYGLVAAWGCMIGHNMLLFALFTVYFRTGWETSLGDALESSCKKPPDSQKP